MLSSATTMKIAISLLLFPFGTGASPSSSSVKNEVDAWSLIRHIPRSFLLESQRRRQLSFHLSELSSWMETDSIKNCDYGGTMGDEQEEIRLSCTLAIGGRLYKLAESCTQPTNDNPTMTCDICVTSSDAGFNFCYAIHCDYSDVLNGVTNNLTDEEAANALYSSCGCTYATLEGKKCEACDLCPSTRTGVEVAEGFSSGVGKLADLSLACPHAELVTPVCDIQQSEAKPFDPHRPEEILRPGEYNFPNSQWNTNSNFPRIDHDAQPSTSSGEIVPKPAGTSGSPSGATAGSPNPDVAENQHPVTSSSGSLADTTHDHSTSSGDGMGAWGKVFIILLFVGTMGTTGFIILQRRYSSGEAERYPEEIIILEESSNQQDRNLQTAYAE